MAYTLNVHLVSVTVSSVITINIFHSPMNLTLWDVFCGQNSITAGTLFRTVIVCLVDCAIFTAVTQRLYGRAGLCNFARKWENVQLNE
jgi:hypothetical protein